MAALTCKLHPTPFHISGNRISCCTQPSQPNIKVVINGAAKEIGRAAVVAVTKARGMEVAGAVDSYHVGQDIGKVCDMEEPLEIPIMNDLTLVLGSISQLKANAVVVDFTDPSAVYDNVKQATAFGMRSIVHVPRIKMDTVAALSAFCEKASMVSTKGMRCGTNSIHWVDSTPASGNSSFISLQQCRDCRIQTSCCSYICAKQEFPSPDAVQIANNISNLGQMYNRDDISTDVLARGQVVGEDGVRVHSLVLPGLPSSTTVYFSGLGEVYTLKHDIMDAQSLMPGLILAIRKVVRLKNLVYGLEKVL